MKKYLKYIGIMAASILLFSCSKDEFVANDTNVGISKVTYYPVITTNEDRLTIIDKGSTYTDAGATATAGGAAVEYTASGTVNTAVAGIYSITYTAVNQDGFSASDFRTVVVIDDNVAGNDFSGNYARSTNASVATWTKIGKGVYTVANPGGAPGTNLIVTVVNYEGNKIAIPQQLANDGSLTSSASESTTAGAGGTLTQYMWAIVNGGYGPAVRTFNKQ